MASALFARAYVHIVSSIKIATQWDLAIFAVCNVCLKLLLLELAKSFLAKKRRTPNMRMMAVTVAAPTILIDTQPTPLAIFAGAASKTKVSQIHVAPLRTTSSLRIINPVQDRVHRLLSLHAAEVYADMYAEYIAMGCSYGILFFSRSHPKYRIGNSSNSRSGFSSRGTNVSITGLQLGIEVVTEFAACALETRWGIDFERLNQDDSFLAVFMVAVALVNVHISSGIYLRSSTPHR
ncbi:uncharacterized protein IUM83_05164 [Phytophthora cinnamomi]|uniref:uncharacterized protein n=1 Tax=Phytophthora cinnamomi TaxID=4785 RepID=UPI00355A3B4A|nr:hypothetical protein IUM83_05164 [Phytophthora cinnamomi]